MPKIILIVALIALGALYYLEMSKNVQSSLKISTLESEISALKSKLGQLSAQRMNMERLVSAEIDRQTTTSVGNDTEKVDNKERLEKPHEFSNQISKWVLDRRITDFESLYPLSDDEKERLRRKFTLEQEEFEKMASNNGKVTSPKELEAEGKVESLEQIVGEERAKQYEEAQREKMAKYEAERMEDELFKLSRKLNLNSEQEAATKEALKQVNAEMKEFSLRANSEEGDLAQQNPFENLKILKAKKQELLNEHLRGVLNDEQLNKLAEDQASKGEFPFVGF